MTSTPPPIVPGYAPPPAPQPPAVVRKVHPASIVLAIVGAVLAVIGCISVAMAAAGPEALNASGTTPSPYPVYITVTAPGAEPTTASAAPTTSTKPPPAPKPTIEDGVWTVGVDVPAGRYRTIDTVDSGCYWAILKSDTNGRDIIANGLPEGGRPTVTIKKGQDFSTEDCGTWRKL